ncbi:MAG TPA: PQQ-dependent sugar dehydrogenase [Gammaproteobacteria bacterium]|nr:PQQ-dependent sugar dehydrogenase [Gammaproteobacteria bacterium]
MNICHPAKLGAAALLAFVSSGAQAQTAPQEIDVQGGKVRVVTVASGLAHPWSLAFLPDGKTLLVAEAGRIRMIRDGALLPEPVYTVPAGTSKENNDKLAWIAVHPRFAANQLVYWSHPISGERGTTLAVSRGRLEGNKIGKVEQVFVADAWEKSGNMAGKILFGPDETLYVTVGDRDRLCCTGTEDNSLRLKAQDLSNHVGKTLRLKDDGTVPKDNPFVGKPGVKPEIYTYGHRNGYGLAFNPETGELWQAEIGPMGGDEVNILQPGHNYGWPLVSMGRNYTGSLPSDHPYHQDGMDDPRMFWVPSISPSSLAFYTGDKFPRWKNSMLVGSLTQRNLQRVSFGQPSQAERREPVLRQLELRIRDVQQGPDGFIYVATERSTGGTAADGTVLRLEPVEGAAPPTPSGPG